MVTQTAAAPSQAVGPTTIAWPGGAVRCKLASRVERAYPCAHKHSQSSRLRRAVLRLPSIHLRHLLLQCLRYKSFSNSPKTHSQRNPDTQAQMPRLYLLGLLGFASVAFGQLPTAPRLVTKAPSAASSTATSRLPQTTVIEVGKGDFIFKPDTIQAAVGDTVEFRFYPTNHSVVRADYLS